MTSVSQLSFFSAELIEPSADDLGGLLAAHAQVVSGAGASRVSVVLDAPWRVTAVAELIASSGFTPEIGRSDEGRPLVRTAATPELGRLSRAWSRGAVKAVPPGWTPDGRSLRAWALAAGRADEVGFLLGVDPHAADTHVPLAAALSRAGLAATLLGPRAGGPALRITGRRRLLRLAETVGQAPDGAVAARCWPSMDDVRSG